MIAAVRIRRQSQQGHFNIQINCYIPFTPRQVGEAARERSRRNFSISVLHRLNSTVIYWDSASGPAEAMARMRRASQRLRKAAPLVLLLTAVLVTPFGTHEYLRHNLRGAVGTRFKRSIGQLTLLPHLFARSAWRYHCSCFFNCL